MYRLHYAPDNASIILRMILEDLEQPYETALVDRAQTAQRSAAYLALNPAGRIPALETPHGVMAETGAAALWLADTHGALAPPPDHPDRGPFLQWLFFCANTLHPALLQLFYTLRYVGRDPGAQAGLWAHTQNSLHRELSVFEAHYPISDTPVVTDFYIGAIFRWLAIYGPPDRKWFTELDLPRLRAMLGGLEARASVQAVCRAEGLGQHPFTRPQRPNPPEGSPL